MTHKREVQGKVVTIAGDKSATVVVEPVSEVATRPDGHREFSYIG